LAYRISTSRPDEGSAAEREAYAESQVGQAGDVRTGMSMRRPVHLLGKAVLLAISWIAIFEIGLRVQQYLGPLYDLEMAGINLDWESDVVNHQPAPQSQNLCIYGDSSGFSYQRSFNADGIRIIDDTALLAECRNPASVLFLGDSFMEGYDDENTLPYHVARYFKTERQVWLKTYNAGYTSYSPAIFVPQAKKSCRSCIPITSWWMWTRPTCTTISLDIAS
jgi:hypothetical protein